MGIVKQDVFVDYMTSLDTNAPVRRQLASMFQAGSPTRTKLLGNYQRIYEWEDVPRPRIGAIDPAQFDRESALEVYGQIKTYIQDRGWLPGKYLRPWEVDKNLYKSLDRDEPWWGFEFETGYKSAEARSEVIGHVWDTWDNVVFDSEGEGNAAVEITFAPEERSKYMDKSAQALKFIEYLNDCDKVMVGGGDMVGTHINMSCKGLNGTNVVGVAWSLSRTLAALPKQLGEIDDVRKYMFGRSQLYGGFMAHEEGAGVWVEGKTFRTTYKTDVFERYLKVCEALSKCMEKFVEFTYANPFYNKASPYVNNLYEVAFEDAEPEVIIVSVEGHYGIDGARGNNQINGPLARDVITGKEPVPPVYADDDDDYDEDEDDVDELGNVWCESCGCYH